MQKLVIIIVKPYLDKILARAKKEYNSDCNKFSIILTREKTVLNFEDKKIEIEPFRWDDLEKIGKGLLNADKIEGFKFYFDGKPISLTSYYFINNQKLAKQLTL